MAGIKPRGWDALEIKLKGRGLSVAEVQEARKSFYEGMETLTKMFKVDPDTKALRIFLRNLLAGIGINSAIQLMLTSFHKLWPYLRNPLYKVV